LEQLMISHGIITKVLDSNPNLTIYPHVKYSIY
jgi:hypothetical protein